MAETTARVLSLLALLQTHRQWSGPELALRMAVTERTLRRDVERLRGLGYRVTAARGSAGGYRLEAGADIPPLLLTTDEAVAIAIGLRAVAANGVVDGETTSLSALAKLEQVLPPALRTRIGALSSSVLPQRSADRAPVSSDLLVELATATRDHERIRFHYRAGDGAESERVVEPHTVVAADRAWFLLAWDLHRDGWRTFRADRIERLFPTRLRFAPRLLPATDAAEFVTRASATHGRTYRATVVAQLPIAEVRRHFAEWVPEPVAVDDGRTSWVMAARTIPELIQWLIWMPHRVEYEIEGSPEVMAAIGDVGRRMARAAAGAH